MEDRHVELDLEQVGGEDVELLLGFLLARLIGDHAVPPRGLEVEALVNGAFGRIDAAGEGAEDQSGIAGGNGVGQR